VALLLQSASNIAGDARNGKRYYQSRLVGSETAILAPDALMDSLEDTTLKQLIEWSQSLLR